MIASGARALDEAVETRTIVLPAGRLDVAVTTAALPLDRLCDFAARNNARRGFLIVSKLLGRHIPTRPADMQLSFDLLAARLADDLPGPVVFIGMAETAICLGLGVHAAWRARTGRTDTLALHTTRQQIGAPVLARFEEPHSHASAHLIYEPELPDHAALLRAARTLVLVDDEASTGTTLRNLAAALAPSLPRLERIATAVLADWSGSGGLALRMPVAAEAVSLLDGRLTWTADPVFPPAPPLTANVAAALGTLEPPHNFGRRGIAQDPADVSALAARLSAPQPWRYLVLGTGEFTYPPFLLAQALERLGHDVRVQATTRSPVHIGGAIASALDFRDNYATDVPNFLYNVVPEPDRRVIICHETPPGSVDPRLVAHLEATPVYFGSSTP